MSDENKKSLGRGRGKKEKTDGPWNRSKTSEANQVVRRPKTSPDTSVIQSVELETSSRKQDDESDMSIQQKEQGANTEECLYGSSNLPTLTPEQVVKPDNNRSLEPESPNVNPAEKSDVIEYFPEVSNNKNSMDDSENVKLANEENCSTLSGRLNNNNLEEISNNENNTKSIDEASNNSQQQIDSTSQMDTKPPSLSCIITMDTHKNETFKSNLSPLAKEFQPNKHFKMNPRAEEFVPIDIENSKEVEEDAVGSMPDFNEDFTEGQQLDGVFREIESNLIVEDLNETLGFLYTHLTENPGEFDKVMEVVTPHFIQKYLRRDDLSQKIIEDLFQYAMKDPSFAFLAVKVLIHLMDLELTLNSSAVFRNEMLRKAREEVMFTLETRMVDDSIGSIAAVLLFISELYIQLEVGEKRLAPIGMAIGELLGALLGAGHIPIKDRLMKILQTMKLTGIFLDQDNKLILDVVVESMKTKLDEERNNLEASTIQAVENLIGVRNSNWGDNDLEHQGHECVQEYVPVQAMIENSVPNEMQNSVNPMDITDSQMAHVAESVLPNESEEDLAVLYGPDGQILSNDELQFLESNMEEQNQDHPDLDGPDGMNREMHEAYEEFLASNGVQ